jgi:hypothetical protein
MSPSQLAQQALQDTKIDMAAIQRIKTMGSRQSKEKSEGCRPSETDKLEDPRGEIDDEQLKHM